MTREPAQSFARASLPAQSAPPPVRTVASYERELASHKETLNQLRDALAREEMLLRRQSELLEQ